MATPSTAELVPIKDIRDGLAVMKDGSIRGVIEISAINFELRSSEEQAAILEQFQSFLNTIDFPMQIIVHSRRFDISAYLATVQEASTQLANELLKIQAQEYMRFVGELAELANIMAKSFYVVIPLSVITPKAETKGLLGGITGIFKKKAAVPTEIPEAQFTEWRQQVTQRADIVLGGLSGMGLKGKLLDQDNVVALFHDLYNPKVPPAPAATSGQPA